MPADWEKVLGQAWNSYRGVYDYEKHLDDKVGRFLTAIAFFVSGGLILAFTQGDFTDARYVFPQNNAVALPLIALSIFLVLTAVTVFLLLTSLGPNSVHKTDPNSRSLFFTKSIVGLDQENWENLWTSLPSDGGELNQHVGKQVIKETREMALNTEHKNNRLNEARVTFTLALLAFTIAIVLGTIARATIDHHAAMNAYKVGLSSLSWSTVCRSLSAAVFLLFIALTGYDELRLAVQHRRNREDYKLRGWHVVLFTTAGMAFSLAATLLVDPGTSQGWGVVLMVDSGIAAIGGILLLATLENTLWPLWLILPIAVAVGGGIALLHQQAEQWLILLASLPVLLLQTPRLSNNKI